MNNIVNDDEIDGQTEGGVIVGGRRHRGSKKRHSKRRGNSSLRAWVKFVKKVQREENVSYKEAMTRAKRRKDKGEKWRGGGDMDEENLDEDMAAVVDDEADLALDKENLALDKENLALDEDSSDEEGIKGGRRRRRTRRRRSRKSRGRKSRRHR
jgi:hypothetical protein